LPWDHAAGILFLNEAGGMAARPDGRAYSPTQDERGLIGAASPALFEAMAELVIQSNWYAPQPKLGAV
jgi:fructose-1,6-bisphosphatase/inositol monophosphatase family enzyme